MTNIYIVRDFPGPDCWPDLFVEADFPMQAIQMWRKHFRLDSHAWPEKMIRLPEKCGVPNVMVWSPREGNIQLAWEASVEYKQLRELSLL